MNSPIQYRHNVMSITSVESFFKIHGGYHNSIRDVYFLRSLGENREFKDLLAQIDKSIQELAYGKNSYAARITMLPRLSSPEDTDFYMSAVSSWYPGCPLVGKHRCQNDDYHTILAAALDDVTHIYQRLKPNTTQTMIRSFKVKLLYWNDCVWENQILKWTERYSFKIVASNVVNIQEYLFYYMLTLQGCDVLLLNNREDITPDAEQLGLSATMRIGNFGSTEIHPYTAPVRSVETTVTHHSESKPNPVSNARERYSPHTNTDTNSTVKKQAPPRQQPRSSNDMPNNSSAPTNISNTVEKARGQESTNRSELTSEKSFEELAGLASSIVMITVFDQMANPVATGSGIMINKNGLILTNHHVIDSGRIFGVRIEDDEEIYVTDEIIRNNQLLDLAIIKIKKELTPLPLCSDRKKLVRGQKVIAIGSPLGLFNSVSDGIISGFRKVKDVDMIQFTAPISHGSSGGAVLNTQGELIGISTAGIDSGQNINLAVRFETIREFAKGLL